MDAPLCSIFSINRLEPEAETEYLGKLYRSLPLTDEYVKYNGISGDMKDILMANPSNHIMSQFYEAFQMMEKGGKP